jgi:hypothetical protein
VTDYSAGRSTSYQDMEELVPNFGMKLIFAAEPNAVEPNDEDVPLRKWNKIMQYKVIQTGVPLSDLYTSLFTIIKTIFKEVPTLYKTEITCFTQT